jgi:hypothetical protein
MTGKVGGPAAAYTQYSIRLIRLEEAKFAVSDQGILIK